MGLHPSRAKDPAVASSSSLVTMLSLIKIGTPWRGLHMISRMLVGEAAAWVHTGGLPSPPRPLQLVI